MKSIIYYIGIVLYTSIFSSCIIVLTPKNSSLVGSWKREISQEKSTKIQTLTLTQEGEYVYREEVVYNSGQQADYRSGKGEYVYTLTAITFKGSKKIGNTPGLPNQIDSYSYFVKDSNSKKVSLELTGYGFLTGFYTKNSQRIR